MLAIVEWICKWIIDLLKTAFSSVFVFDSEEPVIRSWAKYDDI